jgi:hypothetical protein
VDVAFQEEFEKTPGGILSESEFVGVKKIGHGGGAVAARQDNATDYLRQLNKLTPAVGLFSGFCRDQMAGREEVTGGEGLPGSCAGLVRGGVFFKKRHGYPYGCPTPFGKVIS